MKIVNYFGHEVEVSDGVNYLAFELVSADSKYLGYELYGYENNPFWNKQRKTWNPIGYYEKLKFNPELLNEFRENGIKPSKSLVKV